MQEFYPSMPQNAIDIEKVFTYIDPSEVTLITGQEPNEVKEEIFNSAQKLLNSLEDAEIVDLMEDSTNREKKTIDPRFGLVMGMVDYIAKGQVTKEELDSFESAMSKDPEIDKDEADKAQIISAKFDQMLRILPLINVDRALSVYSIALKEHDKYKDTAFQVSMYLKLFSGLDISVEQREAVIDLWRYALTCPDVGVADNAAAEALYDTKVVKIPEEARELAKTIHKDRKTKNRWE